MVKVTMMKNDDRRIAATPCPHCCAPVPALSIERHELERIMERVTSSPSLVIGEIALFGECSVQQARQWADHLNACCRSWPLPDEDAAVASLIDQAFGGVERPADFCDELHCSECHDHNQELKARTTINLRRADLGVQGWDPTGFMTPQALGHLFPALARYALMPAAVQGDRGDYAVQFLWHLDKPTAFHAWCSQAQRDAVRAMLERILETKCGEFECSSDGERLLSAIELWSAASAPQR